MSRARQALFAACAGDDESSLKESLADIAQQWNAPAMNLNATKRLLEAWGEPCLRDRPRAFRGLLGEFQPSGRDHASLRTVSPPRAPLASTGERLLSLSNMNRLDAQYYRAEAKRCQEAAAQARDASTKEHWLEGQRCWIKLANQAELVATLNGLQKSRLSPHIKKPRNADT